MDLTLSQVIREVSDQVALEEAALAPIPLPVRVDAPAASSAA